MIYLSKSSSKLEVDSVLKYKLELRMDFVNESWVNFKFNMYEVDKFEC